MPLEDNSPMLSPSPRKAIAVGFAARLPLLRCCCEAVCRMPNSNLARMQAGCCLLPAQRFFLAGSRLELLEAVAEVGLDETLQIASTWDNAVPRNRLSQRRAVSSGELVNRSVACTGSRELERAIGAAVNPGHVSADGLAAIVEGVGERFLGVKRSWDEATPRRYVGGMQQYHRIVRNLRVQLYSELSLCV